MTERVSAYYATLPPAPMCEAGDRITAAEYLHEIEIVMARGGWTQYEANRLQKLRAIWERRAFGRDPRFELVGTKPGRLSAAQEYALRPKQRRAAILEAQARREADVRPGRRRPAEGPDQRKNPERRWVNLDLPAGKATGTHAPLDSDSPIGDPEAGDLALPDIPPARQYLIPGQDTKGHSQRVWCRVMPAHYRAICAFERDRHFGFRTTGDIVRWCIDFGVRELTARRRMPQVVSALSQVDAIREILLDEQYYMEFGPTTLDSLTETINKHVASGAEGQVQRLLGIVRHQIEQMNEPYWRDKYLAEFERRYATYLERAEDVAFTEGEE